ncbi:MAG: protein phosphatase [Thermoproteota archaeon]|nr:MAG: protein phosphatase [Candidatus Korarchaeota archaeon]
MVRREGQELRVRPPPGFFKLREGLAGSAMPTSPEEVAWLRSRGYTTIVSLDPDLPPEVAEAIEELELEHVIIPVLDLRGPTIDQMMEFCRVVEERLESGGKVLVHCLAGCGRTGTMLAAWLVWRGAGAIEAIEEIRRVRPCAVETFAQEQALLWFERVLRSSQAQNHIGEETRSQAE